MDVWNTSIIGNYSSYICRCEIFITGDKIHNPLDRSHSALRSKNVNLSKGEPLRLRYLVLILMPKENKQMMDKEVIPS